jgi:NADH dehydrogenase/NADH:ubiquinone oxidoreductase subunit G
MAGFLGALALAGGAAKGWGEGQLEAIKKTREEKLRVLELDRAERLQKLSQDFQAGEGDKNRASQERLTNAQLANNKLLTEMKIGADATNTDKTIASNEKLAQLQTDAQLDLNIKPILQKDGTTVWMRGQEVMETPLDPNTGKKLDPSITADDTDQMKNYKFLVGVGVPAETANQLAFESKNANPALLEASLIETFTKSQTTFGNADEETVQNATRWAKEVMGKLPGLSPAATAPAATPPAAVPSSATEPTSGAKPLPEGETPESMIAAAKAAVEGGRSKAEARRLLQEFGIDPASAGL